MNISVLMMGLIAGLLGIWGVGATYIFAPDLFAQLDISDILSGMAMTILAIGGNLASFKPF